MFHVELFSRLMHLFSRRRRDDAGKLVVYGNDTDHSCQSISRIGDCHRNGPQRADGENDPSRNACQGEVAEMISDEVLSDVNCGFGGQGCPAGRNAVEAVRIALMRFSSC